MLVYWMYTKVMNRDELKMLLALNGNQRLPHLEEEIFSDENLYSYYLVEICNIYIWCCHYSNCDDYAGLAHMYAMDVIGDRWPEAEAVIFSDFMWSVMYNKFRWNKLDNL
jgi:hypothetical protein